MKNLKTWNLTKMVQEKPRRENLFFCNIPTDILLYFGNMFVVQMLKLYWKDK